MARQWSAAQHKKFKASMKRRKKMFKSGGAVFEKVAKIAKAARDLDNVIPDAPRSPDPRVRDAVVFLKQMEAEIGKRMMREGKRLRFDRLHLLALLALDSLVGDP